MRAAGIKKLDQQQQGAGKGPVKTTWDMTPCKPKPKPNAPIILRWIGPTEQFQQAKQSKATQSPPGTGLGGPRLAGGSDSEFRLEPELIRHGRRLQTFLISPHTDTRTPTHTNKQATELLGRPCLRCNSNTSSCSSSSSKQQLQLQAPDLLQQQQPVVVRLTDLLLAVTCYYMSWILSSLV